MAAVGSPSLVITDRPPERRLEINRPARANALTVALLDEIAGALDTAEAHDIRAIVLTGSGGRFSAGFDLAELSGTADDVVVDDAIGRAAMAIKVAPVPVIAAVNGPAHGAAVELMRACDVVVTDPGATFSVPATRLGLLYRPEALARLHRSLGGAAARFIVLTGEVVDADHAARLGLVDLIAVEQSLDDTVAALVSRLAALVPSAVAATKALFAALDDGADELDRFEVARRDLLDAPGRRAAISAQQARLSPQEDPK